MLILLPLQLGISKIDTTQGAGLLKCLELEWCGGKRSLTSPRGAPSWVYKIAATPLGRLASWRTSCAARGTLVAGFAFFCGFAAGKNASAGQSRTPGGGGWGGRKALALERTPTPSPQGG